MNYVCHAHWKHHDADHLPDERDGRMSEGWKTLQQVLLLLVIYSDFNGVHYWEWFEWFNDWNDINDQDERWLMTRVSTPLDWQCVSYTYCIWSTFTFTFSPLLSFACAEPAAGQHERSDCSHYFCLCRSINVMQSLSLSKFSALPNLPLSQSFIHSSWTGINISSENIFLLQV